MAKESARGGRPGADAPPQEVVTGGACPFEGCQLGKWTARETVPVFDRPGGVFLRNLARGDVVVATSAEVRSLPRKAVVTEVLRIDQEQGLEVGSIVYVLHPLGEGAVAVWHEGRIVHGSLHLSFRFEEPIEAHPLQWTWWVQIRLANGTVGWLRNPQRQFDGMDAFG